MTEKTRTSYVGNLGRGPGHPANKSFSDLAASAARGPGEPAGSGGFEKIDSLVAARWPHNSFSGPERARLLAALASPDTRVDGLHRNRKGQAIEARSIKAWLDARGW